MAVVVTGVVVNMDAYHCCIGFHAFGVFAMSGMVVILAAPVAIVAVWFTKVIYLIVLTRAALRVAVDTLMPMKRIRNRMVVK